ncbi:LexA family protein [Candidatus Latescibacterota bacterium]
MRDADIHSDDIVIVDRAVEPSNNCVVSGKLEEEFIVKRIKMKDGNKPL